MKNPAICELTITTYQDQLSKKIEPHALNWHNSRQYAIIELVKREVPLWQLSTQKNNLIQ